MNNIHARDKQILLFLQFGLTDSKSIDNKFFTELIMSNLDDANKSKSDSKVDKLRDDLAVIRKFINNIKPAYENGGMQAVAKQFDQLPLISSNQLLLKSVKMMRLHCSARLQQKIAKKYTSPQKQANVLQGQLSIMLDNLDRKLANKINTHRQRDRRNKGMRRLITRGLIKRIEIDATPQHGECAYHLTPAGAQYLAQQFRVGIEYVRAYNFNAHTAAHEITVSRCLRSIFSHGKKFSYEITRLMDEPKIRQVYREFRIKSKAFPDLCLGIKIGQKNQLFWTEIDMGSMPVDKLIALTRLKCPVIIICADAALAQQRRSQIIGHIHYPQVEQPFFISTISRFAKSGILSAGYLTAIRGEFCQCSLLIQDKNCIRDKYGCPCILRYFTSPKTKPKQERRKVLPVRKRAPLQPNATTPAVSRPPQAQHHPQRSKQITHTWGKLITFVTLGLCILIYLNRYTLEIDWLKLIDYLSQYNWFLWLYSFLA